MTRATLGIEIGTMVNVLKADMQDIHIDYMIKYIMTHYSSYTISDLTCLTDRLVKNNPYGKPILQNLIHELDLYSVEKQEYAVEQRAKENSIYKADIKEENAFTKMYAKMKHKSKEPVITQKQKDADAVKANNEKIEQMKQEGLI